ncbi:MAG: YvcK family protein [Candidatus Wildermuthbacteria bacterium]|nr:YvcK family protein [Candidatus Wildermuthbacteria bacterium]
MKIKPIQQVQGKNVVVIGGGTGTYTVLSGLKKHPLNLTAIVSMADDGGSTKILREEFGILPPGSVRPALVALSQEERPLAELFNFRFANGSFNGHNFGNLFITALTKQLGSFEEAIEMAGKILGIKGSVIPSTLQDVRLFAELENGEIIRGEANIDVPSHDGSLRIQKAWLEPEAKANPKAVDALKKADLIVIGPGDIFSSIVPNFLTEGLADAVRKSKAKKVYVCNIMTKFGETKGFGALDFFQTMEQYVGSNAIDFFLVNSAKPSQGRIKKYEKEKAEFVGLIPEHFKGKQTKVIVKNLMRPKGFIRHDPDKLANVIISLL